MGLAEQSQQRPGFAGAARDLVHNAARRADDSIFDLLTERGDAHRIDGDPTLPRGAVAARDGEVIDEVHHRRDFDRGG